MVKIQHTIYMPKCIEESRLAEYDSIMNEEYLKVCNGFMTFDAYDKYNELTQHLYEGLIKTANREDVISYLNRVKDNLTIMYEDDGENDIEHTYILGTTSEFKDTLIRDMNNLGYFVSAKFGNKMKFEAKFDTDVTDLVYNKFNMKLYHISPIIYKDKILRDGLIPRSQSKLSYHPERIYMSVDEKVSMNFVKHLYSTMRNKKLFDTLCLYEIDLSKCPKKRFMSDPNCRNAVYTMENIPPNCITLLEEIKINK